MPQMGWSQIEAVTGFGTGERIEFSFWRFDERGQFRRARVHAQMSGGDDEV